MPLPVAAAVGVSTLPSIAVEDRPAAVAAPVPVDARAAIDALLQIYRESYSQLDAAAAAAAWPTVDVRARNRAFGTLTRQDVRFEDCTLTLDGSRASARCVGQIRYVRRLGDQSPKTQNLGWSFEFVQKAERWQITNVDAR